MARRVWEFSVDTRLPPEKILGAATDFSERRPDIWPAISRKQYHVFDRGDTWADVEEGTALFKNRLKYDWSTAGTVRAVTTESNAVAIGSFWEMRVTPGDSGSSHVEVRMHEDFHGPVGLLAQTVQDVMGGEKFQRKYFHKALDMLQKESVT
jgi:hypothetical protein